MVKLDQHSLAALDGAVSVPNYDQSDVSAGIVHFGVGNFHRAHQAMYVDALLRRGGANEWGIHGVGLEPVNAAMRDVLAAQDNLYTLALRHNDGSWDASVIGSIVGYSLAPDDPEAVLERLADPRIRMVTITVTEGGYHLDPVTGHFNAEDEVIVADARTDGPPRTMFGLVTAALARRRERGTPPFTLVSCDNIQENGEVAHESFTTFARLRDPDLASWMDDHVRFPNSMVDRITPRTTDADSTELARRFGVEDGWPVLCEPFTQWVLEDSFCNERPALEDVGVQLVDDVRPYEMMKLRLLNASHQALAYPGFLVGYEFVHDVVADELFSGFLLDYMLVEAIPTLRPVPGVELGDYARELIERFSNPEVRDTVARLCTNTSDMIPKFLLPVLRDQLAAGGPIARAAAVIAFWARYDEGVDEQGTRYEIHDKLADRLSAAAARNADDPLAFLTDNRGLFGDLADNERFTALYQRLLASVRERGVRATLRDIDGFDDRRH